jgi:hypothetical protein
MRLADNHPLRTALATADTWNINLYQDGPSDLLGVLDDGSGTWHTNNDCPDLDSEHATVYDVNGLNAVDTDVWCPHCQHTFDVCVLNTGFATIIDASILLNCHTPHVDTGVTDYQDSIELAASVEDHINTHYGQLCSAALNHTRERLAPHLDELRTQRLWTAALTRGPSTRARHLTDNIPWWELTTATAYEQLVAGGINEHTASQLILEARLTDPQPRLVTLDTDDDYTRAWLWPHTTHTHGTVLYAPAAVTPDYRPTVLTDDVTDTDLAVIASIIHTPDISNIALDDLLHTAHALRPTP